MLAGSIGMLVESSLNLLHLFSKSQTRPVHLFSERALEGVDSMVITAYLHQAVISEKIQSVGFKGNFLSISEY